MDRPTYIYASALSKKERAWNRRRFSPAYQQLLVVATTLGAAAGVLAALGHLG